MLVLVFFLLHLGYTFHETDQLIFIVKYLQAVFFPLCRLTSPQCHLLLPVPSSLPLISFISQWCDVFQYESPSLAPPPFHNIFFKARLRLNFCKEKKVLLINHSGSKNSYENFCVTTQAETIIGMGPLLRL